MRSRPLWASLSLLVLVGCAASRSPSTQAVAPDDSASDDPFENDEGFEYEGSIVQELVECQLWDEACLSRVQDIRHQAANEAKLDEIIAKLDEAQQARQRQHEETLRVIKRAAGLDPDAGMGFWCLTGEVEGRAWTECRRTWEACADRLLSREKAGVELEDRRCTQYAQAACFRVTRNLEEGERAICYGDTATCEDARAHLDSQGFASAPTACRVTD